MLSLHQPHDCFLNRLFRRRSKETSKLRVSGLFAGNSPGTDEFLAQMASNAENVSIWWRHHVVPQDAGAIVYKGPHVVAAEMAALYPPETRDIEIIDVCAGTGLVGEEVGLH